MSESITFPDSSPTDSSSEGLPSSSEQLSSSPALTSAMATSSQESPPTTSTLASPQPTSSTEELTTSFPSSSSSEEPMSSTEEPPDSTSLSESSSTSSSTTPLPSSDSSSSSPSSSSSSSSTTPPPPSSSTTISSSTTGDPPSSSTSSSTTDDPPPPSSSSLEPPPPSSSSSTTRAPPPVTRSSTLSTPVWVPTTNDRGQSTSTAPSFITTVAESTSSGILVTVTEVLANPRPTLNGGGGGGDSSNAFFSNTGAVAGVFVLVGLAAASILLWIFFAIRRRRRTRRFEHDTAVSATLAAAGFHRAPLDDDDDPGPYRDHPSLSAQTHERGSSSSYLDPNGHLRNGSGSLIHGRRSSSGLAMSAAGVPISVGYGNDSDPFAANANPNTVGEDGQFNPYAEYNPPPSAFHMGVYKDRTSSGATLAAATAAALAGTGSGIERDRRVSGASANYNYELGTMGQHRGTMSYHSAGSHEPLLAGYRDQVQAPSRGRVTPPSNGSSSPTLAQPPSGIGGEPLPPSYTSALGHAPTSTPNASSALQPPLLVPVAPTTSERSSIYSGASNANLNGQIGIAITTTGNESRDAFNDYFYGNNGMRDSIMDTPNTVFTTPGGLRATTPIPSRDGILDPALRERMHLMDAELRDDEDYSRPVLTHRSMLGIKNGSTEGAESEASSNPKGAAKAKVLGVRNPDLVDSVDSDLGRQSWSPRAL